MRPFSTVTIVFSGGVAALFIAGWEGVVSFYWLVLWVNLYVIVLVLGAIFIRWNFYVKSVHSLGDKQLLALTFDDGPAAFTEAILETLKRENVKATFFMIGKHAAAHPQLVKQCFDAGHGIGNHSYHHGFHFDWKSSKGMREEIEETNSVLEAITGEKPTLFRPPYGVTNPNLAKAVQQSGMKSIGWSVRSFDTTAKDANALLARVSGKIKGGDILLLHDSISLTAEILTALIRHAHKSGFKFVSLDEIQFPDV